MPMACVVFRSISDARLINTAVWNLRNSDGRLDAGNTQCAVHPVGVCAAVFTWSRCKPLQGRASVRFAARRLLRDEKACGTGPQTERRGRCWTPDWVKGRRVL